MNGPHALPRLLAFAMLLGLVGLLASRTAPTMAAPVTGTYGGTPIQNCPDPSLTRVQGSGGLWHWYMYCTTDPLHDNDRQRNGEYNFHLIPILHSTDLVTWDYVGDVFSRRPRWAAPDAGLWAADIQYFNNTWYLYYTVAGGLPGRRRLGGGSAIGVATSTSPTGPWTDSGAPVVESQGDRWVFDPFVIADDAGQRYIFYGSFVGGISARRLSADGLTSDRGSETRITVDDRYEAPFIRRGPDGAYYLFASATSCCDDELTGYSVFVGRSTRLLGPYLDRQGAWFLDSRVGGTPVLSMNGNRWVGPGHVSIFTDFAGQDWVAYHAVNRTDPHFKGAPGFTKRLVLFDPLCWGAGAGERWPTVRGGFWASDTGPAAPRPAAQPGQATSAVCQPAPLDTPGTTLWADPFDGPALGGQWSWAQGRQPVAGTVGVAGGVFRFSTQPADLYEDRDDASVLVRSAPGGDADYVVETRVALNVPPMGCCYNYVQAGLVIYGDDDTYLKLVHVAINGTRQTEFAKETPGGSRYGHTVVGPPADWTYLRIVKRTTAAGQQYTAYTSRDGTAWVRGGTWTHALQNPRIGLVSMGGAGFTAQFDYVRVATVTS